MAYVEVEVQIHPFLTPIKDQVQQLASWHSHFSAKKEAHSTHWTGGVCAP